MGMAKLKIENPKKFKKILNKAHKKGGWSAVHKKYPKEQIRGWSKKGMSILYKKYSKEQRNEFCRKGGLSVHKKYPKSKIKQWQKKGGLIAGQKSIKRWKQQPKLAREQRSRAGKIGGKITAQRHPKIVKLRGMKIKRWIKQHPEHFEKISKKGFISKPEKQMKKWLRKLAPDFIHGKLLGRVGVPDFHSPTRKKVIEVDGIYWHSKPKVMKRDKSQRAYWNKMGYTTFSFSDVEIMKKPIETQRTLNNILGVHRIR